MAKLSASHSRQLPKQVRRREKALARSDLPRGPMTSTRPLLGFMAAASSSIEPQQAPGLGHASLADVRVQSAQRLDAARQIGESQGNTQLSRILMAHPQDAVYRSAVCQPQQSTSTAEGKESPNAPISVDNAFLKEVATWTGSVPIPIGGVLGYAHRGEVWLDHQEQQRLILFYQPGGGVVYLTNNQCYIQSAVGFAGDVGLGAVAAQVAKKTRTLVKFIEIEMAFLKGVISGASLPMFLLMTGMDITRFIIENRKKFPRWIDGMKLFLKARSVLKETVPTLYDTIFNSAIKEVVARMPESIEAEDYAGALGGLMGGVLKSAFAGSLTVLKSFLLVLRRIAGKLPRIVGRTISQSAANYKKGAAVLADELRKLGIPISQKTALQMINEYVANRTKVDSALDELVRSVEMLNE